MTTRNFSLGAVLSVTTGRVLTSLDELYEIMNYLTSSDVTTLGLVMANESCKTELLRQHPALKDVEVPETFADEDAVWAWVEKQENLYGKTFEVAPMNEAYRVDPITEYVNFMERVGGPA